MWKRWAENTGASILGFILISLVPAGAVTYLAHIQSAWTKPLLLGLVAWFLSAGILVALDAFRRLPPRRTIPSLKNIEHCVRDWLDNFGVSVKRDPIPSTHFRFIAKMDNGVTMIVGRVKEGICDYVLIRGNLAPAKEDLDRIAALTDKQREVLMLKIRLELAHLRVGFSGLALPASDFNISKRVPIRPGLTEHEFMGALDEIEAGIAAIAIVFQIEVGGYNQETRSP